MTGVVFFRAWASLLLFAGAGSARLFQKDSQREIGIKQGEILTALNIYRINNNRLIST
jgi:hypothetical protein